MGHLEIMMQCNRGRVLNIIQCIMLPVVPPCLFRQSLRTEAQGPQRTYAGLSLKAVEEVIVYVQKKHELQLPIPEAGCAISNGCVLPE